MSSVPIHRRRIGLWTLAFQGTLLAAVTAFGVFFDHAAATTEAPPQQLAETQARLVREGASSDVRRLVEWVLAGHDHARHPFVVVDKSHARLFVFDGRGVLRGSAPVLLGATHADAPVEAATPAGRFVAARASRGQDGIVWTAADAQLSLQPWSERLSPGRGLQRLASPHAEDRRISEGSLHVAPSFWREWADLLHSGPTLAYVVPEMLPMEQVFGAAARAAPGHDWIAQRDLAAAARSRL